MIHQELTRELDQLVRVVSHARCKTGQLDLEDIEIALRSALHGAGAAALSELLAFPKPDHERETIQRALQLDLALSVGEPIRILYIEIDAPCVPVV